MCVFSGQCQILGVCWDLGKWYVMKCVKFGMSWGWGWMKWGGWDDERVECVGQVICIMCVFWYSGQLVSRLVMWLCSVLKLVLYRYSFVLFGFCYQLQILLWLLMCLMIWLNIQFELYCLQILFGRFMLFRYSFRFLVMLNGRLFLLLCWISDFFGVLSCLSSLIICGSVVVLCSWIFRLLYLIFLFLDSVVLLFRILLMLMILSIVLSGFLNSCS